MVDEMTSLLLSNKNSYGLGRSVFFLRKPVTAQN